MVSPSARSLRSPRAFVLLALVVVASVACSSEEDGEPAPAGPATACEQDTRKDVYAPGLERRSADLIVKVRDATPAPPAKLMNKLTLEIASVGGQPVDGATVTVTPFMPDHAHGSAVVPVITPAGGGVYNVDKIYLPMPGLWRLTVTVQPQGAAAQDVAFQFCVEG